MKPLKYIPVLLLISLVACNKYSNIDKQQLSGYVFGADPVSGQPPLPIAGDTVYLANNAGSASYIQRTVTDSTGFYTLSYPTETAVTLYSRLSRNGTQYYGKATVFQAGGQLRVDLTLTPQYFNGAGIQVTDSLKGPIANLPVRLYTSKVMAMADTVALASYNGTTNTDGRYIQYNLAAAKYYIVASDSLQGRLLKAFDSLTVSQNGIFTRSAVLK